MEKRIIIKTNDEEDILCREYIRNKVKKAEENYKNGRYVTTQQLEEESKWW